MKNENKVDERVSILEVLHKYVPCSQTRTEHLTAIKVIQMLSMCLEGINLQH